MARDLSASPWRSAAIAPLLTPIGLAALSVAEGRTNAGGADPETLLKVLSTIWLIAYAHMWVLAVPVILLTRRWVTWSWLRLVILGAVLGALPWTIVVISELGGRSDLSPAQWVSEFFRSLLVMDDYIVVKLGAFLGAFVAGVFCLLQLYVQRAPSNNALEQTRNG